MWKQRLLASSACGFAALYAVLLREGSVQAENKASTALVDMLRNYLLWWMNNHK
jgi:hypothetical protein